MSNPQLVQHFTDYFTNGGAFSTIVAARQQAEAILGEKVSAGTALAKMVDESIEASVVRAAQVIIATSTTTHTAYNRCVNLLNCQPSLNVRSSTSVLQQAYSTPIPIAYLASVLARISPETIVYEPTAGNGALLVATNPANVIANEINSDRFAELSTHGYAQLTQRDAIIYRPDVQVDRVICNPPFGSVLDANQRTRRFRMGDTWTTQIDQVIALNALQAMKADGRAMLILGGKLGSDEEIRSDRYNTRESRAFYYILYNQYKVTQHFSIWGDLYKKQGAGFPIDLIVIVGKGQSQRPLPAAEVPNIYRSFHELQEFIPNEPIQRLSPTVDTANDAITFYRAGAGFDRNTNGNALPVTDAATSQLDDSTVDGGNEQLSSGNPNAAGDNPQRNLPQSRLSNDRLRRSGRLATSLDGDPDSEQLSLWASHEPPGRDLSSNGHDQDRSRISGLPDTPSGNLSGGMADRSHVLRLDSASEVIPMNINEDTQIQALDLQPKQVPYLPRSKGSSTETLIPFNMASAAQGALDKFEQQYSDIDDYLATRLGYASIAELHKYFSAEQVDAAALAISNIEQGKGFILGDQTGVGKGRVCASIMRYAQQQGKAAIFITQKKTLYADMMRDVADIGMQRFYPFATDTKAIIPLHNGHELKTNGSAVQDRIMREMMQTQTLNEYSAIFTTYNQLQTISQKEPLRRDFLRTIAPNAILILDEAHEAGGTKNTWKLQNAAPDRADFVRELVDRSIGVFYSSATYAKRPDVMDLYARRTDLRHAVRSMTTLENILTRGGVPLQQMVASKFVASGQMLRRERSFDGISFQAKVVSVDREVADQFSGAMRAIKDFDRAKQKALKTINKRLKAEAKDLGTDQAVGEVGARSTNFTSLMHNCIEQGLLAQKAEATVEEAIYSLQNGQKPVIALANTMGSFIEGYAEAHELNPGDPIDVSFSDLLERYLERSRDVIVRDYRGHTQRYRLTDEELGDNAVAVYEEALECIAESDLSSIPISPIDYITQRLEQAGYRVTEVTGRKAGVEYLPDDSTGYKVRPESERTARARIDAVARFNSGDADVIILNCSGSTGISLHASEKFADQRPRHMIVAQAERDINVFMQMLGRVHRTGQVELPSYTLLMGDLPAEKRPGAILCRKMASLNANTTAARETDISITNVVDFMNPYGEQVVQELLTEDLELDAKLDFPLAKAANDTSDISLIKRVTGSIPLLPIAEQEIVYDLIESEYRDLLEQQQAMGESLLEADQLDLDARPLARMEISSDTNAVPSEFTGSVYLDVVDVKSATKPLTQLQMINSVRDELDLLPVQDVAEHNRDAILLLAQQRAYDTIAQLDQATDNYRIEITAQKEDLGAIAKFEEKLNAQSYNVRRTLRDYLPGTSVRVVTPTSEMILYGVVAGVDQKQRPGSPVAPTNWKIRILVADSAKQLAIPLSKFNNQRSGSATVEIQELDWFKNDVYTLFDKNQEHGRVNRQIFTGNIIKAFEKYPKGKLVNYTDYQNNVLQGLIMPKQFDIHEELTKEPVTLPEPHHVKAFLTDITERQGAVKTLDELLILRPQFKGEGFVLQAPRAKESGGQYYLDEQILAAVGSDFHSVADRMEVVFPPERLEQTLHVLMKQRNYALATFDFKDQARKFLGVKLPELQAVELEPITQSIRRIESPATIEALAETAKAPEIVQPAITVDRVAPANQQIGSVEKNIARFLEQAGLAEAVLADPEFCLTIPNQPYIPLTVERHDQDFHLIHWLRDSSGDLFIDTEMVFELANNGKLSLYETATQNPLTGGEARGCDHGFARIFSRNILDQGFAAAALQMQLDQLAEETSEPPDPPTRRWGNLENIDRTTLEPFAADYLKVKDQHPDVLVLQRDRPGNFYVAYLADAETIAPALDLLLTSQDAKGELGQIPAAGFPSRPDAVSRFMGELQQQGLSAILDEGIHQVKVTVESRQVAATSSPTSALLDANQARTLVGDYQLDIEGYDPSWAQPETPSSKVSVAPQKQAAVTPVASHQDSKPTSVTIEDIANQVRNYDLESVAANLGLQQDHHDKRKWKDGVHTISINDGKFMDWQTEQGGGGAIDLVMHVREVDFKAAVEWLSGRSLPMMKAQRSSSLEASEPARILMLPQRDDGQWQTVRQYLTEMRGLPTDMIDDLHTKGLIYADDRANAVFLRYSDRNNEQPWTRGEPTGASLRGTHPEHSFHQLASGSARENGWFWLGAGRGEVQRVMLTESAIDTISLVTLEKGKLQLSGRLIYLSTDGAGAIPVAALNAVVAQGGQVVAAFDADQAGEKLAWRVAQAVPGVQRLIPAYGKDWNERLLAQRLPEPQRGAGHDRGDPQLLRSLWQWHRVAKELGHREGYLVRITEVAREVVEGKPLPDKAISAMQQDLQRQQQQKQRENGQGQTDKTIQPPAVARKHHQGAEMGG